MALWQFTTFTVLIGALIVYAAIITRRLGLADARLTRMEDALLFLARSGSVTSVNAIGPAAEVIPEISEVFEKPPVSPEEEARRVYLTMRDLRARSEQRANRASSPAPVAVPEPRETLETTSETQPTPPIHSPDTIPEREDAVAIRSESLDAPETSTEPTSLPAAAAPPTESEPLVSLPATATLSENAAATLLENGEAATTNTESQSSPDDRAPHDDAATDDDAAAAKKSQEILVFLSAQRRRRRARLGY